MKILTVVFDLGPGGTQRVAVNYAVGYKENGIKSAVLAYRGTGVRDEFLDNKGIPVFVGGATLDKKRLGISAALEWNPDVVHIHRTGYPDAESGAVLRQFADGRRKVMETNVFARFDRTSDCDLIDLHLMLSHWCLWKFERWSSHRAQRPIAAVVPNAVDSKNFYPLTSIEKNKVRREWGIPGDAFVFGRIGQPGHAKWSPCIFPAFTRVAKSNPEAYLVLVGLPSDYEQYISKLPKDVKDRVITLPFQHGDASLRLCYGGMDVFLHASRIGESFGMVLCEAMLCGVPVITLSTPCKDNSQGEVVGHNVGGLVVRHKKYITEAMLLLMKDDVLYRNLSEQARQRVLSKFEMSVVIPKLVKIATLLNNAKGRDEVRQRLEQDAEMTTTSDWKLLNKGLQRAMGRTPPFEDCVRWIVHQPHFYNIWSIAKKNLLGRCNHNGLSRTALH